MEPDLGLPGARGDGRRQVVFERFGALGAARRVLVVPGRFDEQPAGVAVAGLGDVAAVLLVARRVLRWGQAEVAHQLARMSEAAEVADLGEQPERGSEPDAAERAEPADRVRPWFCGRDLAE